MASELALPCYGLERHDLPIMGRPARDVHASLPRSFGACYQYGRLARWAVLGQCMSVSSSPILSFPSSLTRTIATDLSINLWDLGSGRKIKSMTGHTAPINTLSFSACTSMLISGGSDWTVRAWDVKAQGGMPMQSMRMNGALPDGAIDEREGKIERCVRLFFIPFLGWVRIRES